MEGKVGYGQDRAIERRLRDQLRHTLADALAGQRLSPHDKERSEPVLGLLRQRLAEYGRDAARRPDGVQLVDPEATACRLYDSLLRFGPIQPYMDDPTVEDILVNGPWRIFVRRRGVKTLQEGLCFDSDEDLLLTAKRLLGDAHQLDVSHTSVGARLPGGSRIHVIIPPTSNVTVINIRRYRLRADSLEDLVEVGTLTPDVADFLAASMRAEVNLLISGPGSAGKTTLLRALYSSLTSDQERVATIEDPAELGLSDLLVDSWVMEPGEHRSIRDLIADALRMSPTRIVLGEVRSAAAWDMLSAMNTGHPGSGGTIHANNPRQALDKLAMFAAQAPERVPKSELLEMIAQTVDLVLQLHIDKSSGARRLTHLFEVEGCTSGAGITGHNLWELDPRGGLVRTPMRPNRVLRKMELAGVAFPLASGRSPEEAA
ncbi:MAG: Flp pilus assembly complex ATPase component TadA [Chloroflexota bacterium]|nr:Flp pilus assembly complex ATPase component TadA [Chloroflexota bacterium]